MEAETSLDAVVVDEASVAFLGQWQRLVSTTNWEKGRIILQWRQSLVAAGAAASQSSDEAWSRRVGTVSGQHVGRLRRVYERFADTRDTYPGLYWSHFQAALDWNDAEMWLEGAVQSQWSVAEMRRERWEAMGGLDEQRPRDEDIVAEEADEDYVPSSTGEASQDRPTALGEPRVVPFDEAQAPAEAEPWDLPSEADAAEEPTVGEPVRPFADLAELPADLAEAFEAFKLAILHHKLAGWSEVSCDDVLASLSALRQLALAE